MTGQRTISLPLSVGHMGLLQARFPLQESEWEQLMVLLQVMKPGLTLGEEGEAALSVGQFLMGVEATENRLQS